MDRQILSSDTVLKYILEPVLIVDHKSRRIMRVNPAVEALFGYREDELVGRSTEILHVDRAHFEDFARRSIPRITNNQTFEGEFLMRKKDGTVFQSYHQVSPLLESGSSTFVISVVRDITEEKESRHILSLLNDVSEAIIPADTVEEALRRAIETICQHFGWKYADAWLPDERGRYLHCVSHWTAKPDKFRPMVEASRKIRFRKGEGLQGRVWESGKAEWIGNLADSNKDFRRREAALDSGLNSAFTVPICDDLTGELVAILGFACEEATPEDQIIRRALARITVKIADVLQRKAAELNIRINEEYFRALIENALDIIVVTDAKGMTRYSSPSVGRILGFDREEQTGNSIFDFIDGEEEKAKARELYDEVRSQPGAVRRMALWTRHKDGSGRYFHVVAQNLLDHPAVKGIVLNAHDMTERRSLREQLVQAQKLEALGQLTSGIAHDFNNLLAITAGYAQELRKEADRPEKVAEYADVIEKASKSGSGLIDQLLSFARRQSLEPERLDLSAVLNEIAPLLKKATGSGIHVETAISDDLAPVYVDRSQFDNALLNLVINGRDAMPKGGKLTIHAENVEIAPEIPGMETMQEGGYVRVSVADTGAGIPEAILDRVFDPFFTTKDETAGTGLGLSMVHGFAEQSGGKVTIDSAPDRGTKVEIYLPHAEKECVSEKYDDVEIEPSGRDETVLIVEENDLVRRYATMQIRRLGYRAVDVADGTDALKILSENQDIRLMITDLRMSGGLAGDDLAREAAGLQPGLGVVFTTSYESEADASTRDAATDAVLLKKPFSPSDLATALQKASP